MEQAKDPKHYTKGRTQPWDYIRDNELDYFEGNVIKYVTRHKEKGGKTDIEKAKTYLEKMLLEYETMY